ncbi:MAG: hypothetical protein ACYDH1_12140 [Anaerolineaceae bacterium]
MKKQLRSILVFGILALLGIFFWKTEFLSTYLVEPIVRIMWLFFRILRSFSQMTYWLLLIFAILPLIIRILPETSKYSIKLAYKSNNQNNDRVRYWDALIKAAEKDKYDRLRLQRNLQTLSQSLEDLSFRNDNAMILLPSLKRGYLGWVRKAGCLLPLLQRIQHKKAHNDPELYMCIDQILKSMENQMEGTND